MNEKAMRRPVFGALILALSIPCASFADDLRLLGALDETAEIGQLAEVRGLPGSLVSVAGVKLFHSDLEGLQSKFGPAPIARLSSREGAPLVLCYFADDHGVIFRAGAMGGWKRVTGFTVLRVDALGPLRLTCAQSAVLTTWMRQSGKGLLSSRQLSKKLGMTNLPANGVMTTKRLKIDGQQYLRTSVLAYSQGSSLDWVDVSQFDER